jgi:hypothetical protein
VFSRECAPYRMRSLPCERRKDIARVQLMRAPHPLVTVARLRSESTSQFTALALNKPSSSSSKLSLLLLLHDITVQ